MFLPVMSFFVVVCALVVSRVVPLMQPVSFRRTEDSFFFNVILYFTAVKNSPMFYTYLSFDTVLLIT